MPANTDATGFAIVKETAQGVADVANWRKIEVDTPSDIGAVIGKTSRDPISTDRNRRKGGVTSLKSGFGAVLDATLSHLIDFLPYFILSLLKESGTTGRSVFAGTAAVDGGGGVDSFTVTASAAAQVWAVDDTPAATEFVDETADFNSATPADFAPFTFAAAEAVGDYVAFGFATQFDELVFDGAGGTAGTIGVVAWEYLSSSGAWTALSGVTDGTSSFTAALADGQVVSFTKPSNWGKNVLNASASLYYVRARITTVYTVLPIYDQGWIGAQGALEANELVYARGFTNSANNGLFVVAAGSTPTSIKVPTASLTAEAAPPANAQVEVAGYQGASGDLQIDASGDLISTVLDFTTLGLSPGQYIKHGGTATNTAFAVTANNGYARIVTVAANKLTLSRATGTFAIDNGAGKTIQIFYGSFLRDVDINDVDFVADSLTLEVAYDFATPKYVYPNGNYGNELTLSLPIEDKSTLNLGFIGIDTPKAVTTRKTGASAALAPNRTEQMSTVSDIAFIKMLSASGADIGLKFRALNVVLKNNLSPETVLGTLLANGVPRGKLHVDLDGKMLFEKTDISDAIRDNDTLGFQLGLRNGDGAMVMDFGELTVGDGKLDFPRNQTIEQSIPCAIHKDAVLGYGVGISFFPHIPVAA